MTFGDFIDILVQVIKVLPEFFVYLYEKFRAIEIFTALKFLFLIFLITLPFTLPSALINSSSYIRKIYQNIISKYDQLNQKVYAYIDSKNMIQKIFLKLIFRIIKILLGFCLFILFIYLFIELCKFFVCILFSECIR